MVKKARETMKKTAEGAGIYWEAEVDTIRCVLQSFAVCCSVLERVAVASVCCSELQSAAVLQCVIVYHRGEVGGWGRDPKKCTGRDWGMGSSTI